MWGGISKFYEYPVLHQAFILLIIYYGFTDSYFIWGVKIHYCHLYIYAYLFYLWPFGILSSWLLCPFDNAYYFFSMFILVHNETFKTSIASPASALVSAVCTESLDSFGEGHLGSKIWTLGMLYAFGMVTPSPFQ